MTPEAALILLLGAGCEGGKGGFGGAGSVSPAECAATCSGCCSEDGACRSGTADASCGEGGEVCIDCSTVGNSCSEALCWNEALTELEIVDDSSIHIRDADDAARLREDLIHYIWWDGVFPDELRPDEIEEDVTPPYAGTIAASVDRLSIDLGDDYISHFYLFHPSAPTGGLVIVHQGHGDTLDETGADLAIEAFLDQGALVMAFFMPLYGEYTGPAASHDEMIIAETEDGAHDTMSRSPLAYFIEPVTAGIGYALDDLGVTDITMTGVSGGGWTTTLYAALDPRVRLSLPVAGSLPNYLRTETDLGDYEQYDRELYSLAGYLDLYILGGWGEGRQQIQVLNRYDTCCFWGLRYQDYEADVQATVESLGQGSWSVFLDESHQSHTISAHALEASMIHALAQDGVVIVDDIDPAWGNFQAEGAWTAWTNQGFGLTLQSAPAGSGEDKVSWTLEVEPGTYELYATWVEHENRASNAPYTVEADDSATLRLDQRSAPADLVDSGGSWAKIGTFSVSGNRLVVTLSNDADGVVIADGLMARRAE